MASGFATISAAEPRGRDSDEKGLVNKYGDDKQLADASIVPALASISGDSQIAFKLYRRRFVGMAGLFLLNFVGGMCWPWFGPIANDAAREFDISLTKVNWLGNVFCFVYLPVALAIPLCTSRFGIRRCCEIGSVCLVVSSWIRYAGTAHSLSNNGAYALLLVGQLFAAVAQPTFQILAPKYSELWFNLQGRTTATMVLSIANPIGSAIGQLISPLVGDVRQSILVLGIICTVVAPSVFFVASAPPTPPTYAGAQREPSLDAFIRAWLGLSDHPQEARMSVRERVDFAIILSCFGALVGASNTFALLTAQYVEPVGYSSDTAGFLGATLLLTGIVTAILSAPLFDRVLTHRLALTSKILVVILGFAWLSLIWAVRPHNAGALYAIMAILGGCSVPMIPIGLELAVEVTRNAAGSSALCWASGNLFAIIFLFSEDALRAPLSANPPENMKQAIIFQGAFVLVVCLTILGLRGQQVRRSRDEEESKARGGAEGAILGMQNARQ